MFKLLKALALGIALLAPISAFSQAGTDPETWEKEEAWLASASVNTQEKRTRLQQLLRARDDTGSLQLLREIELEPDWPAPARERVIYEYVNELRKETPRIVGEEVIAYLTGYQSSVLVPHEDHPRAAVPMFNIRAAANGVVNEWSRQEAAFEGATLVATNPGQLLRAYENEKEFPRRRGLLDALDSASQAQLVAVSQAVLPEISLKPELIAVAHRAAIRSKDIHALTELAENGRGADMHRVFRDSAELFSIEQNQSLLEAALRNPSRETASLAIAQFSAALKGNAATEQLLIQLLDDPKLGSSAALALALAPSEQALESLQAMANAGGETMFSSRARLALDIHAAGLGHGDHR